ncbi:MAG TPA: hypothetical protein VK208_18855 [Pyrinomonadaceae bacterium]|nr:hypothetical protein [Pyrinomonadaceae bacterium]
MPYFLVDGKSIYERLQEPAFHLLTFTDDRSDCQSISKEISSDYPGLVDYHVLPLQPQAAELFVTNAAFNVLLRPDNYIAFISTGISLPELRAYFNNVIGRINEPRAMKAQH